MCTAISYRTKCHYFGRNLDLERDYGETITVTPRNYPFSFRTVNEIRNHYAIIGTAAVINGYPLYFDATNEKGLSMAGLNFPENAYYTPIKNGKDNITPFEFIPWVLSRCKNVTEAEKLLDNINLVNINFSEQLPLSPLHWIISDKHRSLTVEPLKDGLKIYKNSLGILTNNPNFDYHVTNLNNYMNITVHRPVNRFSDKAELAPYSLGMGGIGLPGDLSSASRFVRAAFTKLNSISSDSENESISQCFHILGSVTQQKGCTHVRESEYEFTLYSSCCNTDKGIYYYKTYYNSQISAVDMNKEDLDNSELITYKMIKHQQINYQN